MEPSLPVDPKPANLFLKAPSGLPVWPVFDGRVRKELYRVAKLFGGSLVETKGEPVRDTLSAENAEIVVALGDSIETEARLYAHLTQRGFRKVKRLNELDDRCFPAVLVTTPDHINSELLNILYSPDCPGPAPGLLFSSGSDSLRFQVLIRSAAAILCGPMPYRRIDLFPLTSFNCFFTDEITILGGRSSLDQIKSALGKSAGVLTLHSHSDGIDAYLAADLTLCPLARDPQYAEADRSPRCHLTGFCHRQRLPIKVALEKGKLISIDAVSARVLVLSVCTGIIPANGNLAKVLDGAWGLIPQLLDSSQVGAALTTWQIALSAPRDIEPLSHAIAAGIPLGQALANYHRSTPVARTGRRFCLLGDPAVRLPKHKEAFPLLLQDPVSSHWVPSDTFHDAAFLRMWLRVVIANERGEKRKSARGVIKAVDRYEESAWSGGDLEATERSPGPLLRRAMITHLARHGTLISQYFIGLCQEPELVDPSPVCFACGQTTITYLLRPTLELTEPRRLGFCSGCGVIEDVPTSCAMSIHLSADFRIQLDGPLPVQHWSGAVIAGSTLQEDFKAWNWPASESTGAPSREFQLQGTLPPGPLRIVLLLLWDAKLALLQLPGRAKIPRPTV